MVVVALASLCLPFQLAAEDKPSGEIKEPREGDEVKGFILADGRSRKLEDGWTLYFFTQQGSNLDKTHPGTHPHCPVEPNRRFEEVKIGGKKPGDLVLYLYALPPGHEKMIEKWKAERKIMWRNLEMLARLDLAAPCLRARFCWIR